MLHKTFLLSDLIQVISEGGFDPETEQFKLMSCDPFVSNGWGLSTTAVTAFGPSGNIKLYENYDFIFSQS